MSLETECRELRNLTTIRPGCCPSRESILATETPVRCTGYNVRMVGDTVADLLSPMMGNQRYDDIAIASQMTADRLHILESMAERWEGMWTGVSQPTADPTPACIPQDRYRRRF